VFDLFFLFVEKKQKICFFSSLCFVPKTLSLVVLLKDAKKLFCCVMFSLVV